MTAHRPVRMAWLLAIVAGTAAAQHDQEPAFTHLLVERLEYHEQNSTTLWDLQGWSGGDYRKFRWKSEGRRTDGATGQAEVQLLYSKAFTPFFDWQIGVRHDFLPGPSRSFAVFGLQGLAPYWFEVDLAAFVSDEGDLSARLEVEYDLLITQRLVLQPRVEISVSATEVSAYRIGGGLSTSDAGLRLRYEFSRKFAPYAGIGWEKRWGDTADLRRATGDDTEEFTLLAGLWFWF